MNLPIFIVFLIFHPILEFSFSIVDRSIGKLLFCFIPKQADSDILSMF